MSETPILNPDTRPDDAPKVGLVLSGGGARGAYQAGVLSAIAEMLPANTNPFDVITGVSVGAINACYITARAHDMREGIIGLRKLWQSLHCNNIYRTGKRELGTRMSHWALAATLGWAGVKPPTSLLDNTPLKELLLREVDFDEMTRILDGNEIDALAITASSYGMSQAVSFYYGSNPVRPWERSRRIGTPARINEGHILASSALPVVFPAQMIDNIYYGDGALRQNAPLSPAIHLGVDRVLVIGVRDNKISGEQTDSVGDCHPNTRVSTTPYPNIGFMGGQMLDIVFNDNLESDVERLRRINKTLGSMVEETREKSALRKIEVEMIQPSQDIRDIAGKNADELPFSVKTMLRTIGALKAPWVLPSYLNFEPGYVNDLINLGYQDGMEQREKLREFLDI